MSDCVNGCGKPCCADPPGHFITKCIYCKARIRLTTFCGICRCLFDEKRFLDSVQICAPWRCFYVCVDCSVNIASICFERSVYEGGTFLDRIWKPGQRFEWLHIGFKGGLGYTFRKAVKSE
jgi:hypothetical protein